MRVINNQTRSSVSHHIDGGKVLRNDDKTAAGISVEWQLFNWTWIISCVTDMPCACVRVLMQPLCFAKS